MTQFRMPSINQVSLCGRLVQEPDYRTMENGAARLSGRLAVNRPYRDRTDSWQEEACFFNFVLWQKPAELWAERLHKGTPVYLVGRLRSSSWRDAEDHPHSRVEIQVLHLQLLERDPNRADDADHADHAESDDLEDEAELATA